METTVLLKILTESVKKNGAEYPLTLGHLLNIIKLVDKIEEEEEIKSDVYPYDPNWD